MAAVLTLLDSISVLTPPAPVGLSVASVGGSRMRAGRRTGHAPPEQRALRGRGKDARRHVDHPRNRVE